jgi:hypothetical protein
MNLLCPTCQKPLQVPEQYAGQAMQCPLCKGTFTVPVLPSIPAAAPPAPPMQQHAPSTPKSAPPPMPAYQPQTPVAAGQPLGLTINPRIIPWIAPGCLILVFVLMFLAWTGMYPGGIGVVTQSGWGSAFGSTTVDEKWKTYATATEGYWKAYYGDSKAVNAVLEPGVSVLLIFFILLFFPTLLAAVGSVLISRKILPMEVPGALAAFWPLRSLAIAALILLLLVLLVLPQWSGFPLEQKASEQVKAMVATAKENATTPEKTDKQRWEIEEGVRLGCYSLRNTSWLSLVMLLLVLGLVGAGLDFWKEKRGGSPQ